MAFKRITENDMLGKGNVGKPDTPGVSTSEMQRIMDELPREVIAPAFNELSGQLEANTASADIGANAPDGITPDPAPAENSPAKLQSVLQGIVNKITDHIADQVKHVTSEERTLWNNASNDRHTHDNKSILDGITSSLVGNWNAAFAHISDAVRHITENERTNWNDKYTKSETDKAINDRVVEIGSSDMTKAVYDPETRNLPYIPKIDAEALTLGKNVVLSGAPVSIAYAGAQRIASITAYGETPQGGTTEAPVALTGVDSVQVCGNNLLPDNAKTVTGDNIRYFYNTDGFLLLKGQAYTLVTNINSAGIYIKSSDDSSEIAVRFQAKSVTYIPDTNVRVFFDVYWFDGVPDGALVWLNLGESPLPYEPYQGSVTTLPIPRPLRRVGYVRDVCRTRVKSVYDKRVVLDGSENWIARNNTSHSFSVGLSVRSLKGLSDSYYSMRVNDIDVINGVYLLNTSSITITDLAYSTVEEFKAHLSEHPLTVYYQSAAYNGTNGLDVCLTEYQTGFVEPDGTEGIEYQSAYNRFAYTLPSTAVNDSGFCSHYKKLMTSAPGEDKYIVIRPEAVYFYDSQYTNADAFNAYLAAQKEAGTPVQVAYQLSAPEVYATDPIDFDNAAGPLTVLTGGAVEVRMTELVGSRSPELAGKMDKATYDADGDGVVNEAEKVSNALTLKNAAGEVVATFDGSEAAILQLTAALVGALGKTEKAADSSKLAGLTPVIDNPGPSNRNSWYFPFTGTNNRDGTRKYYAALYADNATTAGRASNLSMGLNGTDLWVYYS